MNTELRAFLSTLQIGQTLTHRYFDTDGNHDGDFASVICAVSECRMPSRLVVKVAIRDVDGADTTWFALEDEFYVYSIDGNTVTLTWADGSLERHEYIFGEAAQ